MTHGHGHGHGKFIKTSTRDDRRLNGLDKLYPAAIALLRPFCWLWPWGSCISQSPSPSRDQETKFPHPLQPRPPGSGSDTEIPSLCRSQHRSAYATHIYGSPGLNAYLVPIECGPEPLCPLERGTAVDRPLAGGRGTSCHGGLGALVPLAHACWQPVPESFPPSRTNRGRWESNRSWRRFIPVPGSASPNHWPSPIPVTPVFPPPARTWTVLCRKTTYSVPCIRAWTS